MDGNYEMLTTKPDPALARPKQTEARVGHLNRVLRAIRNVNQLIARERDRDRLLQGVCASLVESRGYYNTWIALFGKGGELAASASAGTALDFPTLFERLGEGETMECMRRAMAHPGVQVIPDPVSACPDCPLSEEYAGRAGLATGLWQAGRTTGLLVVSVSSRFAGDEEEQVLLEEVASDIALALHDIEAEQRRRQAEAALQERVKELTCLYAVGRDIQEALPQDELLRRAAWHLLPAMQFSEITVPVVELDGERFTAGDYVDGLSHSLQAELMVGGQVRGRVAVYYTEDRPFLLPEEQNLVNAVAEMLAMRLERARSEETRRDSEERFATVMNSLQAIVYVADMESHELLFVNKFARDSFGDVVGQRCWQALQAEQTGPCEFCTNKHLVEDGRPTGVYTWEFQNTITGRWYHIQDQAIRWIDGRLARMEVATDVTAIKETEKILQRQVAELNAFGHTVAHDLKNPLGMITAYSDLLLEEIEDDAPDNALLDRYAQNILGTSLKMARIIDELLLLASVRTVEGVTLQELDMAAIVTTALERLSSAVVEQEAELIAPEAWPAARGYAPWIEEVWVNYISNALKYGGQPPRIELGATPDDGDRVRFWVRDNGAGLGPQEQGQLFTQFTRLHQVRVEGHGLGLSIVRRIMDKMGGEVGVESEPGRGSKFYFVLPGA